jgi:hypothetical protein
MSSVHRQIASIPKTVKELRRRRGKGLAHGADDPSGHRYRFLPRLREKAVSAFEREHDVELPEDYRYFLTHVGNGGTGPGYGLFPLPIGKRPRRLPQFGSRHLTTGEPYLPELGDLGQPFPWTHTVTLDEDWESERWEKQPGVIVLAHQGCACFWFLVVRGPAYGTVWDDGSGADGKLEPTGKTFVDWYWEWLDSRLDDFGSQPLWLWQTSPARGDAVSGEVARCPECGRPNSVRTRVCPRCQTRAAR